MKLPKLPMLSPTWRVAIGLVGLVVSLLLLVDFLFGVLPDREAEARRVRTVVAESVTTQVTDFLRRQELSRASGLLETVRQRTPDLVSAAVRDARGVLVLSSGPHAANWAEQANDTSRGNRVVVPIHSSQGQWGRMEFEFAPATPGASGRWLGDRMLWLALGVPGAALLLIYLYLRRTLMQLNPMTVVPERLRAAFDALTEGVALLDLNGRVVLANEALRRMAGVGDDGIHGRPFARGAHLSLEGEDEAPWQQVLRSGAVVRGTRVQVGSGATKRSGVLNCSPIADPDGRVRGCLATIGDVTEIEHSNHELRMALANLEQSRLQIEAQNQELVRLATRDALTGLHNRRAFFESAGGLLAAHGGRGTRFAVLMLDVDHFKSFNDQHGHHVGDLVLQAVARQIAETLRQQDVVARYGGEEFCALLVNVDDATAHGLAERVRLAVAHNAGRSLRDGSDLTVTLSVGLCSAVAGSLELPEMLKRADAALYEAKRGGRNRVVAAREDQVAEAGAGTHL